MQPTSVRPPVQLIVSLRKWVDASMSVIDSVLRRMNRCLRWKVRSYHPMEAPNSNSSNSMSSSSSTAAWSCLSSSSRRMDLFCFSSRTASRSPSRSEEHTSELQSRENLVCRLLLEKKKKKQNNNLNLNRKKKKK